MVEVFPGSDRPYYLKSKGEAESSFVRIVHADYSLAVSPIRVAVFEDRLDRESGSFTFWYDTRAFTPRGI